MKNKSPKQKKPVRKLKAGSAPIPQGPTGGLTGEKESTCGHMACTGGKCNVRYCGPTTPVRDHHIIHTARHASHIWSAAIVSGLAVVLTGAIGYAAFGAEATNPSGTLYGEFQQINQRLDKIETMLKTLVNRGGNQLTPVNTQTTNAPAANECVTKCNQDFANDPDKAAACAKEKCAAQTGGQAAQDQTQCKSSCEAKYAGMDLTQEQRDTNVKSCMERNCPAQPASDSCTSQCKEKNKDDAAATSACLKENCGVMPYAPVGNAGNQMQTGTATPTAGGLAAPTAGTNAEECLKKCYNDRVACFKEAGSNYVALRTCVSKEAACKTACTK